MVPDKQTTLADAIAQHVQAGDVLHPVVGHTRWTRGDARGRPAVLGAAIPNFTLVMLSLSSLGALFFRGGLVSQGDHRLLGRHVPELHAEPVVRARVRAGRGRGRALVVPRVHATTRGGRTRPARGHDPLDRRLVDGGERRVHAGRHARSARSGCSRRSCPTSRCCTHRSPTAPATSRCTRRCSKGCGARSRPAAARS